MQDKSHLSDQPYLSKNTKNKGLGTKKNTTKNTLFDFVLVVTIVHCLHSRNVVPMLLNQINN